jgi:hypothetical protein
MVAHGEVLTLSNRPSRVRCTSPAAGKKAITGVADWLLSKTVELAWFPRKGRKSCRPK